MLSSGYSIGTLVALQTSFPWGWVARDSGEREYYSLVEGNSSKHTLSSFTDSSAQSYFILTFNLWGLKLVFQGSRPDILEYSSSSLRE